MRDDPSWKVIAVKKIVKKELVIDSSMQQMYGAKKKTMQSIDGVGMEQFCKI